MTARDGAPMALPFVAHMEPDLFAIPALQSAATPDAFRTIPGSVRLCNLDNGLNTGSAEQCLTVGEAGRLSGRPVP